MSGSTSAFLSNYLENIYTLKGVIISDNQGIHISSIFGDLLKNLSQKLIQTSTLLISAVNQANCNMIKMKKQQKILGINYYYRKYLIHIQQHQNMIITIFMNANASVKQAQQICSDLFEAYQKLNVVIPDIKQK